MTANHAIGEVGISYQGADVIFRPSLLAISRLGSPADIIGYFVELQERPRTRAQARRQFRAALHVLSCCADDQEPLDALLGGYSERMHYQPGVMPLDDIVTLARHLILHGVAGVSPKGDEPLIKGEPMREFDAAKFAAMAIAHLGMSEADAWNQTMTGLLAALRSKFPPDKSDAASITEKQYTDSMGWLAKVNAMRDKKHG